MINIQAIQLIIELNRFFLYEVSKVAVYARVSTNTKELYTGYETQVS